VSRLDQRADAGTDASGQRDRPPVATRLAPYALWLVFTVAYATVSLQRFGRFETPSWDNAIFTQAIAGYANLGAPVVDIKGPGFNILGDHFSPIIALVAPFYRIFPDPRTLLVAQAVAVGFSVVPIARLAIRRLGLGSGLAVAVAYGLSFGIAAAIYVDFHEVAFAAVLLALAGEAYVDRRWGRVALWAGLLLLVKEDLGLTVVAVGAAVAVSGARKIGLLLAVGGLLGFALVLLVLIPAANPDGVYDYVDVLGGGSGGAGPVATLVTQWDTKVMTVLVTLGVTGFLALRSPWVLVVGPTLAWRFVGDNAYYWDTDFHYSLVLMPVVFVAMVDAMARVREERGWVGRYAVHAPAVAVAVALALLPQYPLAGLVQPGTYAESPRGRSAEDVIAALPAGASVETDIGLITHLAGDRPVYWVGTIGAAVPDYMLIDQQAGWGGTAPDVVQYAEQQHPGTSYEEVFSRDGYLLARRTS